jgi:predicted amidophosphoribosyltransferase
VDIADMAVNFLRRISVDGIWRGLQFALLPPQCLLCGQRSDCPRDLCTACADDLVRNRVCCPRCALPLQAPAPFCGECLKREPPFAATFAPFVYAEPLDQLMTRLKFGRSLAAGRVLSQLWIDALCELPPPRPDLLIPVPLHPSRLHERGYNQALGTGASAGASFGNSIAPRRAAAYACDAGASQSRCESASSQFEGRVLHCGKCCIACTCRGGR